MKNDRAPDRTSGAFVFGETRFRMSTAITRAAVTLLLAAIAGTVATWDKGPEFGPKWYPLALVVLAIPGVWLGGKLAQRAIARK